MYYDVSRKFWLGRNVLITYFHDACNKNDMYLQLVCFTFPFLSQPEPKAFIITGFIIKHFYKTSLLCSYLEIVTKYHINPDHDPNQVLEQDEDG